MSDEQPDTKPGPPNPQSEGMEAPTPPGSPMRQDQADCETRAGGHDDDASASPAADRSASEAGGHTIPLDEEQPDPEERPSQAGDTLQFENAETSLDQPSEG